MDKLTKDILPSSVRGRTLLLFVREMELSRELDTLSLLFRETKDDKKRKHYLDRRTQVMNAYGQMERRRMILGKHLRYHYYIRRFEHYYDSLLEVYKDEYGPEQAEYEAFNAMSMYAYHVVENGKKPAKDK